MKRYNYLFEDICRFENLCGAYYQARKGKRQSPTVAYFETKWEHYLLKMEHSLRTKTYRPGAYTTFYIHDPKKRMISAAPFFDRVVHHALCQVIEPIFDRTFIYHTYANRSGKGTHAAIRQCQKYARQFPYVLKADIKKYFPSIHHATLKGLVRRKIKCRDTLWLVDLIIDHSNPQERIWDYFPGDNLFSPVREKIGLPMGNLTSQFFANLYLSPLDHYVKESLGIEGYIRYVDDFLVFGIEKGKLQEVKHRIDVFLKDQLRLMLHPKKSHVFPVATGIPFLGQRVYLTHRKLQQQNVRRLRKRMRYDIQAFMDKALSADEFECKLNAWLGHARQADTFHLRHSIYQELLSKYGLPIFRKYDGSWKVLC